MENQKFYTGMLGPGVEIFNSPDGLKFIQDGKIRPFSSAPFKIVEALLEQLSQEPETHKILIKWFPDSEVDRVRQFASCRFGGLDFEPDLLNGKMQDGEFHPCPRRGNCEAEGILCKMPKIGRTRLTLKMVQLMRLLSGTDTNETIAHKLDVPLGTFHYLKKRLYLLLDVQTKQEVALKARDMTIV